MGGGTVGMQGTSAGTGGRQPNGGGVIALRAGYAPSPELARDILRFCRERLAPYKRIRRIEFTDLPKTISGKIRRVELRGHEQARPRPFTRAALEFWDEDFPDLKG